MKKERLMSYFRKSSIILTAMVAMLVPAGAMADSNANAGASAGAGASASVDAGDHNGSIGLAGLPGGGLCAPGGFTIGGGGFGIGVSGKANACNRAHAAILATRYGVINPYLGEAYVNEAMRDMGSNLRMKQPAAPVASTRSTPKPAQVSVKAVTSGTKMATFVRPAVAGGSVFKIDGSNRTLPVDPASVTAGMRIQAGQTVYVVQ